MVFTVALFGQTTFPVNGVVDERPEIYALRNATIYQDYQTRIDNGTLVIRQGKVVAAGTSVNVPKGAIEIDLMGKTIYPAFVDPHSNYGIPEVKSSRSFGPQYDSEKEGAFGWNEALKSDYKAISEFTVDSKNAKDLRKAGFGAVVSFRNDGISRGSSVFALTGEEEVQKMVLKSEASAHLSFNKGSSGQLYPTSIMGYVALVRQTYYDADWYARSGMSEQTNQTLASFNQLKSLPQIFEANGGRSRVLLADQIGDEFGIQYIIKGNGDEYQRINDIKATGASLILPLNFPAAYDVSDPLNAIDVSLADLKHWENAPANPVVVAQSGIDFAFTADGLKKVDDYLKNIRKAISYGLSEANALKAMTYTPARLVRMDGSIGSLQAGKVANFIVADGNIFDDKTNIEQTWVLGKQYFIEVPKPSIAGEYDLSVDGANFKLNITGSTDKPKAEVVQNDTTKLKADLKVDGRRIQLAFSTKEPSNSYRLSGWISGDNLKGNGQDGDMEWINWTASMTGSGDEGNEEDDDNGTMETGDLLYPFVGLGSTSVPQQEDILLKNATVWTMEDDGILENADVLIKNGKIAAVGQNLSAGGAREVDATGKHVTPGIIDEHSHAALFGVNESSHAVTAEVSMYDAIDADDIDIYRQLSGGVTAAQLLHGSANPVGGRSALVKFRWGQNAEGMKIKGADGYIKFALGENVKQSNRSSQWVTRYPQTRMGVEQVYVNSFNEARAYDNEWKRYNALSSRDKASAVAPRRDLQLEAMAEILNSERFITCHSYVQSEINMLMNVAEQFGFRVNTFTHILEGYKVADKMAEHGVGGSTFSDWWAYKYEVKEAIPYNAALMTQAGVTVAINSDDAEMARRLNQEAAKSVKYGGMDEYEAMKMVTINPAKLLHLEDRMGSLKVGKDADVVMWNDHPLSIYAKSEMTIVDGTVYYDIETDQAKREYIKKEKARIIAKMKEDNAKGGPTQKPGTREKHVHHCREAIGLH